MTLDTIPILTDSTLIETVHFVASDTLVIKIQHCATSGGGKSTVVDYVLKNGITIVIALIAGLLALYQVKSNVIATARIKRMEDLRINLSELYDVTIITRLNFYNATNAKEHQVDIFYEKYTQSLSKFNILSTKIKMQLDSTKDTHSSIERLIQEIDTMLDPTNIGTCTYIQLEEKLNKIVKDSKSIFRDEWKQSKGLFKL